MARADEGTRHSSSEGAVAGRNRSVRRSTETKSALKTTELAVFVAMTAAVLIAALIVDDGGDGGFAARQSWLYVTLLAVGYMISRGLAKSGSRDPYTDDGDR